MLASILSAKLAILQMTALQKNALICLRLDEKQFFDKIACIELDEGQKLEVFMIYYEEIKGTSKDVTFELVEKQMEGEITFTDPTTPPDYKTIAINGIVRASNIVDQGQNKEPKEMKFLRLIRNRLAHWLGSKPCFLKGFPKGPVELVAVMERFITGGSILIFIINTISDVIKEYNYYNICIERL